MTDAIRHSGKEDTIRAYEQIKEQIVMQIMDVFFRD